MAIMLTKNEYRTPNEDTIQYILLLTVNLRHAKIRWIWLITTDVIDHYRNSNLRNFTYLSEKYISLSSSYFSFQKIHPPPWGEGISADVIWGKNEKKERERGKM
jgi:hypothetical protein